MFKLKNLYNDEDFFIFIFFFLTFEERVNTISFFFLKKKKRARNPQGGPSLGEGGGVTLVSIKMKKYSLIISENLLKLAKQKLITEKVLE